jgi:tRNA(Ile)-lysidine synthase TilS/MesJ
MFDDIFNNIYSMLKIDNKILKELKNDFNIDEIKNGILNSNIVKYRTDKYNRPEKYRREYTRHCVSQISIK